ncbi:hypothetical protein PR048_011254 [Dryococelus australis]|uniref:Cytochrome c domain-containing protein n=1 Tax=Dryococelus australis TaxID=614101 RepID=A0ABQ9HL18_9NEOP|nr:hypothetical protein PR048_011254 [Dryococelus australis]
MDQENQQTKLGKGQNVSSNACCNMAATTYEFPEAKLRRYLKNDPENLPVHGGSIRKVVTSEQLDELRNYLTEMTKDSLA